MLAAALIGFGLGFFGSIPVAGPIAVLVLARGLSARFKSGFFIALGSAIAEGLYAALAFWGFGALIGEYPWVEPVTRAAGAAVLLVLGVVLVRSKPHPEDAPPPRKTKGYGSFMIGFGVTAVNPTLIATWTAAVTAVYGSGAVTFSAANAALFAVGTMLGIASWSSILLYVIHKLQKRFHPEMLIKAKRITGWVVLSLSLFFVYRCIDYFV